MSVRDETRASTIDTDIVISGFTAGSILFIDSVPSLAEDNANLFWDDTSNQLGIGINSSLLATLHIHDKTDGSSNRSMILHGNDRATPTNGDASSLDLYLDNSDGNGDLFARLRWIATTVTNTLEDGRFQIFTPKSGTLRNLFDGGSSEIVLNNDGVDIDMRIAASGQANAFFVEGSTGDIEFGGNDPGQTWEFSSSTSNAGRIRLTQTNQTASGYSGIEFYGKDGAAGTFGGGIFREQSTDDISIWTGNDAVDPRILIQDSNGYVGIGTKEQTVDAKVHISDATTNSVIRMTNENTTVGATDNLGMIEFETRDIGGGPGINAYIQAITEGTGGETAIRMATGIAGTAVEAFRITNARDIQIPADSKKLYFGAGQDASITYNGTDLILNPAEVGTGQLTIDQNSNGVAIQIDSESTSVNVLEFVLPATTTGNIINMNSTALTTGSFISMRSTSNSASTRDLICIIQDSASADGAQCIRSRQDSSAANVFLDQDGNGTALEIDSEATTSPSIDITSAATSATVINLVAASLTIGKAMQFRSTSADTSVREVVTCWSDNASATGTTALEVIQDAANQAMIIDQNAASAFCDYQGTASANTTDPISTHATAGTIQAWLQIEVNGTKRWLPAYSDPSA